MQSHRYKEATDHFFFVQLLHNSKTVIERSISFPFYVVPNSKTVMESAGFNVISWNVNGLRTINIGETLAQLNCFILGIQETKLASKFLSSANLVTFWGL